MRLSYSLLLGIVVFCFHTAVSAAAEDYIPDPKIQQKIKEIPASAQAQDFCDQRGQLLAAAMKLQKEVDDNQRLFMEVLYFCEIDPEGDEQRGMSCMLLWPSFSFSSSDRLAAVLPYIESPDKRVRRAVRLVLSNQVEWRNGINPYDSYGNLIRVRLKRKEELPASLVRYMYHKHPGLAMKTVVQANPQEKTAGEREAIWAEHVVADNLWQQKHKYVGQYVVLPDAAEQLEKLAAHDAWWARLYVAEIMRQQVEFRQPKVIEQLAEDTHPLVRESVSAILTNRAK